MIQGTKYVWRCAFINVSLQDLVKQEQTTNKIEEVLIKAISWQLSRAKTIFRCFWKTMRAKVSRITDIVMEWPPRDDVILTERLQFVSCIVVMENGERVLLIISSFKSIQIAISNWTWNIHQEVAKTCIIAAPIHWYAVKAKPIWGVNERLIIISTHNRPSLLRTLQISRIQMRL